MGRIAPTPSSGWEDVKGDRLGDSVFAVSVATKGGRELWDTVSFHLYRFFLGGGGENPKRGIGRGVRSQDHKILT